MLTKNKLKYYSSLLQKKNRIAENKFIVEGKKLVEEGIISGFKPEIVFCTNLFFENEKDYMNKIIPGSVRFENIKNPEFEKLCDTKSPQGIAAVFNKKEKSDEIIFDKKIIAALENISDPGNMGTIFRNCDWFGVEDVIISKDCAEVYNPKVLRASMGSVFHLNIVESENFISILKNYKKQNYDIVIADLDGENLYKFKSGKNIVIVFCNEANGPSEELLKLSNRKINIPQKGKAESLNVASASAVILSELTK